MPTIIWDLVEKVFDAWGKGELKQQPQGPMKQTILMYLKHVCDDKKMELLGDLIGGKLTVKEFQVACGKPTKVFV